MQQLFFSLYIDDDLDREREENAEKNKLESQSSRSTRSVPKKEQECIEKDLHTTAHVKIESGSTSNEEKVDSLIISQNKQGNKKEEKVLLKTKDTIKMSYTAFTCHNRSAYETAVFDIKSVSSEISGMSLDETKSTSSTLQKFQENIENTRLNIGDMSPRRELEQYEQNIQKSILYNNDTSSDSNVMHKEFNKFQKEIDSKSEGCSVEESADEYNRQVKSNKNIFSIGRQMMNNLINWSFDDYETASSANYLHRLSKRLTK